MPNRLDLPTGLPVPQDDGACDHLPGMLMPELWLASTEGYTVHLGQIRGRTVVYCYPRTGHPDQSIPATALAYSLNVTVVPNASLGFLTMWPAGQTQPTVLTLNSDGRIKANAAIVPAGTNGGVNIFASSATQVVLDIDGYFVTAGTASSLAFYPLTPCRVADTRNAAGPLGGPSVAAGTSRAFPVRSNGEVAPAPSRNFGNTVASHLVVRC